MAELLTHTYKRIKKSVQQSCPPSRSPKYIKIYMRWDQNERLKEDEKFQSSQISIYAPEWVKEGLSYLSKKIPPETQFIIYNGDGTRAFTIDKFKINTELSLRQLVLIARNEPVNVSGEIQFSNYGKCIDKSVIYSLKDLVRQCVIVGVDKTMYYGGYPNLEITQQENKVYIADLVGLQFQQEYNSGRLVLIGENIPKGFIDDLIFKNVVGEEKASFEIARDDTSGRYLKISNELNYFDIYAYNKFVSYDFVLTGLALNEISNRDEINFKFLKYGTGYFAGHNEEIRKVLNKEIIKGVQKGIEKLFLFEPTQIKSIELPFYTKDDEIVNLCNRFGIECSFSNEDALKTTHLKYVTATTNCADPHTVLGNEMEYSSVDAAIGKNLKSKGNVFSPIINSKMKENFIKITNN